MHKFLILWIGQLLSLTGSQLTGFALGVWVYEQTKSATLFALIITLNVVPVILLSPLAGMAADRWNRRHVMLLGDLGAGICTAILAICAWTGFLPIWLIAIITALNATFSSFLRPAFTAAISQLVPSEKLGQANGMVQVSYSVGALVSPSLGGLLLSKSGLWGVLWVDVVTFVIAILTQVSVRIPNVPPAAQEELAELTAQPSHPLYAWSFLKTRPGLLALLLFFTVKNFLTGFCQVLMTPLILSFTSVSVLGGVLSTGGIGMLAGGVLLGFLSDRRSRISVIVTFTLLGGFTLMAVALKNSVPLWFIGAFLFFLGTPLTHGSGQIIFQRKVPFSEQGKIFAFNEAVAGSALPLSYLIAGPLSDRLFEPWMQPDGLLANSVGLFLGVGQGRGIALLFLLAGLLQTGLAIAILKYPPLRNVERTLPDVAALQPDLSPPDLSQSELDPHATIPAPAPSKVLEIPIPSRQPSQSRQSIQSLQPMESMPPLIEIEQLDHYFGKGPLKKQVLFDINLAIHPGEIVIMTGPSGSGKTTLLTLIGALRSTQAGSIKILGEELKDASGKARTLVRRNIGFIFQGHNLLPFMTARQNVRMALELKPFQSPQAANLEVDAILAKVGLQDQRHAYPEKLSGGQKQRVAIARALVNHPPLILADEPTASLDSKTGRDIVQLMQYLAKEQRCAILLVTHDHRILDIADRIIHMEDGHLVQSTSAQLPRAIANSSS